MILQKINGYNTYDTISVQKFYKFLVWRDFLYSDLIYRFIIIVVLLFLMGHVLRCGIVANFQLILNF